MNDNIKYCSVQPGPRLSPFVDSFWMVHNQSDKEKSVIGLPDGRIDLFFSPAGTNRLSITLIGMATQHDHAVITPGRLMFAISFKPLAVEYILRFSIADLANNAKDLPSGFWEFDADDLKDFDTFHQKAQRKICSLLPAQADKRKQELFELIEASKGEMSVKELSEQVFWSSRQINRYFNRQLGLSLKTYCNILRFRASLEHIADGKLFPELNFSDQNHFIKEIKKFSGVVPKELASNENDRFILLSTLKRK